MNLITVDALSLLLIIGVGGAMGGCCAVLISSSLSLVTFSFSWAVIWQVFELFGWIGMGIGFLVGLVSL
jgi:hypothetical protein